MTRKQAEKRGWIFVHEKPEEIIDLGDGLTRRLPGDLRAERVFSPAGRPSQLINEQAETLPLLLERIASWERSHEPLSGSLEREEPGAPEEYVPGAERFVRGDLT